MTGMAFGSEDQDEEEIWRVVAFVQRLPTVTEEDYAKMDAVEGAHAFVAATKRVLEEE